MLKEVLLIHPLGQALTFAFGVFNLVTGWTRTFFILPLHINLGVLFYALTFIGSVVGLLIARMAANDGKNLAFAPHFFVAAVFFAVLICAMLSGFFLLRDNGSRKSMSAVHRYSNLVLVVLFAAQAVTGLRILVTAL